jgi:hypothetical protein
MKSWHRDALRHVKAQLAAHDPDADANDDEDASETQSRTSRKSSNSKKSKDSPRKHSLERLPPRGNAVEEKTGLNFKQTSKTRMKQIHEMRDGDERMIADKCERERFERELQFEKMLDEIQMEDEQRVYAGQLLDEQDAKNFDAKKKLYEDWNREVNGRMEYQLFRSANPNQAYVDDVTNRTDPDLLRKMRVGDDPIKRALDQSQFEDKFRRTADSIIYGINPPSEESRQQSHGFTFQSAKEGPSLMELDKLWDSRNTSRTVLEPTTWGQLQYQSTSYGFFASSRRNERGSFFTQRRMGLNRHVPHSDGIDPGGTLKTRLSEPNDFGILTGEWGKRGQTSIHKEAHGPSSGAPGQDHYTFEDGLFVTDQEFPLGRRMFRNMH